MGVGQIGSFYGLLTRNVAAAIGQPLKRLTDRLFVADG
jgi:hypothetical protein